MEKTYKLLNKITINSCRNFSKRRKYPINPDAHKELPVFQYPVSKENYRRVYVFGNTKTGALGVPYLKSNENLDKIDHYRSPKRLGFAEKFQITEAACGFGFTVYAVNSRTNVKLYGTGINTDSQIGYHAVREDHPLGMIFFPQPISLPLQSPESKILKLAAGRAHLLVLTDEGLFSLGNNAYGQCGRPVIEDEDYSNSNYVHSIPKIDGKTINFVEAGQDHSLAVTQDGAVYSCGWGSDGQTGLGHFRNCADFSKLGGEISNEKIVKVAGRSDFVLALNENGNVFGWGNTEYGQISLPSGEQQLCVPTYIEMLKPLGKIIDIASGGSFCLVLNEDRDVFVWGYGLLGTGPNVQQSFKPIKIPTTLFGRNDFQPNNFVTKIVCGMSHMIAVTNLGDAYSWGRNRSCCLGLGDDKDQYFPLKVSLGGLVEQASCGIDHSVVICKPFV